MTTKFTTTKLCCPTCQSDVTSLARNVIYSLDTMTQGVSPIYKCCKCWWAGETPGHKKVTYSGPHFALTE